VHLAQLLRIGWRGSALRAQAPPHQPLALKQAVHARAADPVLARPAPPAPAPGAAVELVQGLHLLVGPDLAHTAPLCCLLHLLLPLPAPSQCYCHGPPWRAWQAAAVRRWRSGLRRRA